MPIEWWALTKIEVALHRDGVPFRQVQIKRADPLGDLVRQVDTRGHPHGADLLLHRQDHRQPFRLGTQRTGRYQGPDYFTID